MGSPHLGYCANGCGNMASTTDRLYCSQWCAEGAKQEADIKKANDRQVGGSHYAKHQKTGEGHWDRMWRLYGPAWFIGNITKYAERALDKNGVEDLEKVVHCSQKYLELVKGWLDGTGVPPGKMDLDEIYTRLKGKEKS